MSGLCLPYDQQGWVSSEILITWKSYLSHLEEQIGARVHIHFSALICNRHYLLQVNKKTDWKNAFSTFCLRVQIEKDSKLIHKC